MAPKGAPKDSQHSVTYWVSKGTLLCFRSGIGLSFTTDENKPYPSTIMHCALIRRTPPIFMNLKFKDLQLDIWSGANLLHHGKVYYLLFVYLRFCLIFPVESFVKCRVLGMKTHTSEQCIVGEGEWASWSRPCTPEWSTLSLPPEI